MRDIRVQPRSWWELRPFRLICSKQWYFLTDVSVQPIGPVNYMFYCFFTFFFFSHFAHLDGFLWFCLPHLEIFHSQNVFLQSSTDDCSSPSPLPLVSSLSALSTLPTQRPHSSLYKPRTNWIPDFLFGFLTLEDGTDKLSRNVLRNYHYTLRNNREERWN